ncbi:unnamed protein product [Protopolystoma xenopodis]|uniref:Uncharacterized protein n=1 Tax=Protopolystoma xenopodis TaxID=117903 RepID=A0A3S5AKS7_9PLAT|nr:unnamed protein product [Protopolystoma xenopodis]
MEECVMESASNELDLQKSYSFDGGLASSVHFGVPRHSARTRPARDALVSSIIASVSVDKPILPTTSPDFTFTR